MPPTKRPADTPAPGDEAARRVSSSTPNAGASSSTPSTSRNPYAHRQAGQNLPKFSSVGANARLGGSGAAGVSSSVGSALSSLSAPPAEKINPYLSHTQPSDGAGADSGLSASRKSQHRPLTFHRPGRHIKEAEELRREHKLEQLKLRIQESTRKAGLEEGLEGERALRKEPPPEVEWWDAAYLPASSYDAVSLFPEDSASSYGLPPPLPEVPTNDAAGVLLIGAGTPIDSYVQHPIPIPAPTDKITVEPRGVMLTKKEMKKMRKQRRAVTLQDRRDRIKMGLLPPDPPKVKLSNLMRVLTSEAVADPTKVEAKVRREVAARKEAHERANKERKLTKDERWLKEEGKRQKDEMKGVFVSVYKILHLASPSHKFKVRANAKQFGLTGLCIFHPSFALVVVEGASKGIKGYKRLMTHRINWNDPGRQQQQQSQLEAIDWSSNYCSLLFEGPIRERLISKGFVLRNVESDAEAKEVLGPRMESYWGLAKREGAVEGDVI
ncbi:Putative u4/u6 small nuclear ribonucleoprotein [Ceraceosorus bombacis]|uniref:Putative u4/u6 small nuclear ribonucleoprotein n=1 Tax=Ceraceosorus bombacis TaxID=401625 RepID=A0A0P1BKC2_9BASI|nr:Putative u4/u6 small nuclear ribonucleoprotein [Ceraceosorus bombacis]